MCVVQLLNNKYHLFLASVYVEPTNDINNTLNHLEHFLKSHVNKHIIIGGDFNGWHTAWGSNISNKRGRSVHDIIMSNDLILLNDGKFPTFETVTHGASRTSFIDLTMTSANISNKIYGWQVNMNACPTSEHNAIDFFLKLNNDTLHRKKKPTTYRYNTKNADWSSFSNQIKTVMEKEQLATKNIELFNEQDIDNYIKDITNVIQKVSSKVFKHKGIAKTYIPWWNSDLERLKLGVIKLHHRIQTLKRSKKPLDNILLERKQLKQEYLDAIRKASTEHFKEFCSKQGKENVWSLTNRLLKNSPQPVLPSTMRINSSNFTTSSKETAHVLLNKFYPNDTEDDTEIQKQLRQSMSCEPSTSDDRFFTEEEVIDCLKTINPNKAPGNDHLTADICLAFTTIYKTAINKLLNRCFEISYFPKQWKIAHAIILPKFNKSDLSDPSSYRPIGLINVFGKLFEKLLSKRLTYHININNKTNPKQFGFKEQLSTSHALKNAVDIISRAKSKKELVIAVSLDIQAAFDNAWWPILFKRLTEIKCPRNIYKIILNYIKDRLVTLNYADVTVNKTMTRGCIQGSVCGPIFWNLILDDLFNIPLPEGCHLQAFADDVLLIVAHKNVSILQMTANSALKLISEWGKEAKLRFGPNKTQLITFTPKAKMANIVMSGITLEFSKQITLLGVIIDRNLKFIEHAKYITNKALSIYKKLCIYVRPTWGIHPENIEIIYRQVIEPIITYAAGIWGDATKFKVVRDKLISLQRGFAIKIIRAFRTVSASAAISLALLTPLHLKVSEVANIETSKLSGKTEFLPDDIAMEKPLPHHNFFIQLTEKPSKLIWQLQKKILIIAITI
ncbi:unnamed protein product [Parnassius mnemosyne]|uniref:Reverse transcriptase domain-containing protein n=1 Tax=Parnassius mnemosyne TaxID=213953 RepID=A0AAV1LHS9_9NEOP